MQKISNGKPPRWMNPPAVGGAAYRPTTLEHWANVLSHGLAIPPALWMAWLLVETASQEPLHNPDAGHDPDEVSAAWRSADTRRLACRVYGVSLVSLFSVSTVFHAVALWGNSKLLHHLLHRADRAMIYVFIASSYTPWLVLRPLEGLTANLRWGIWVLAIAGIIYQQVFHECYKLVDTVFYVLIGVLPSLALLEMTEHSGMWELKLGGFLYLVGVVFFKLDGRLPLAHAVWHLLVVAGSYVHYTAVSAYLVPPLCSVGAEGVCLAPPLTY